MRRLAISLVLFAACGAPAARPPTAVIDADPEAVCRGDGFATVVHLSGARSSARLSLVPGPPDPDAPPLLFDWTLSGADHDIVAGDLHSMDLQVVTAGDRPLQVALRVTNDLGGISDGLRAVPITIADAPPCGDCPTGTTCSPYQGAQACLPTGTCTTDDDCPQCFHCRTGQCEP